MTDLPTMKGDARVAVGASYFEVPLFSHVIGTLWQGCSPAEFPDQLEPYDYDLGRVPYHVAVSVTRGNLVHCHWLAKQNFNKILNLFQWGAYEVPEGVEQVTVEMYDSLDEISDQVEELADLVIGWLEEGHRVLVHCQAGLNRSSLIVARVLMKMYAMTADEAIETVRESRSQMCLCNESFVNHLKSLDA